MIIARAPYRISLFGGGTDYPHWYQENEGVFINFAINRYCNIHLRELPPYFSHLSRVVWSQIELVRQNEEIKHPVVRQILSRYMISTGIEIHHFGDLPARSGIGSSSAFTCAMLLAAKRFVGFTSDHDRHDLALEAIRVEREELAEAGGVQDQYASAFGGFNIGKITRDGVVTIEQLAATNPVVKDILNHVMLIYTHTSRTSHILSEKFISNAGSLREVNGALQKIAERALVGLSRGDCSNFGHLLDESWWIKRRLPGGVSNESIDQIYSRAKAAGAKGGKLIGAGGGGFMLLWADPVNHDQIRKSLTGVTEIPVTGIGKGAHLIGDL